jgi:predicted nucleic acid-binding protein
VYILDSDILRLYLRHQNQQPRLVQAINSTPWDQIYSSVITVEEGIEGARKFIKSDRLRYYEILARIVPDLASFQILPVTTGAMAIYRQMPERLKQHHRNDWMIAASAIDRGFAVVTRNTRDYEDIQPPVRFLNWT